MKHRIKTFLCCLLISQMFLMTVYAKPDWPADMGIQAEAGIVIDADSGAVIFGQKIHEPYPPASITKILTALLVLENSGLDETVTFSRDAVYNVEEGSGNKLNVDEGDQLSVEDCLYSMILHSCNQAANALAEHVAGSREKFVEMMNQKLAELGCTESHFDNPSGLNGDTQYVTAYDMAIIARAAYNNEKLVEISAVLSHNIPPTKNNPEGLTIYNEHRLVKTNDTASEFYYPPAVAGKTGYLIKAGNTLVTYAEQDGRRMISVILKGKPKQYFVDGKNLLEFGFGRFENLSVEENEKSYTEGEAPVVIGEISCQPSDLSLEPGAVITVPKGAVFTDADKSIITQLQENAPKGAVGLIEYKYNDRKIGEAYLISKTEAAVSETLPGDEMSEADGFYGENERNTEQEGQSQKEEKTDGMGLKGILLLAGAVLLAVGGICYVAYLKKKEAIERERRREERRRRLKEEGEEEVFERILKERRQGKRKDS